ncbi:MAG: LuxR C-terminal-related transcriptional regulator [Pseudomonadota bacterium]
MTEKPDAASMLTTRENQIAADYAKGESYQQIADRLCLAPSSVRTYWG